MIPYFELTQIHLGPLTIQVWGTMVALGILIGAAASTRFGVRLGLDKDRLQRAAFWVVLSAFIGARLFHILAYDPATYLADPWETFKIWHGGFSAMGGFIGAVIGYVVWVRLHKINWLKYADALVYGLPLGMGCGRIGCFLIHDHPGTLTNSPLGVRYPDGQVRHDHGLYLAIDGFLLALVFFILAKKKRPDGFFCQLFLVWAGLVRFFLDFYRLLDARYFGLTPAQYGSVIMVVAGVAWAGHSYWKRRALVGPQA
ncbi:MAG: prolipoprotein diacylglyceryl transferase [Parcubacteria group bacterium]|nr:prolipoprotein diacylglyceryl transferase [Parcubacteria group bacterium]